MNTEQFVSLIKRIVAEYANAHLDKKRLQGNHGKRCFYCVVV